MNVPTKKQKNKNPKKKTKKIRNKNDYLDELKQEFITNTCDEPEHMHSDKCNDIATKKEELEIEYHTEHEDSNNELYPTLTDPLFSEKIANKKEFHDTQYDGEIFEDVKEHSDSLINENFRVLQAHQSFVKNFLSFQTPFNSLLLYHGLGSGKTCSAIGVCEESRDYLKQTGGGKKIMIVASPNVLDNFKKQMFDETQLKGNNGLWSISSCLGNKLIDEINPTNIKGIPKEKIILQIKQLIKTYYVFMGYIEFANYITRIAGTGENRHKKLQNEFNDRLLVIDEIHNIRVSEENTKNKVVADSLHLLISNADRLRLLLLSATPMYNNCTEIIWLLNLLNINDRRPTIKLNKVFNKDGDLTKNGMDILVRKMRGYVSYVRGENPYTFPFRIFPKDIDTETAYNSVVSVQMNGKKITNQTTLDLYAHPIGDEQLKGYDIIMDHIKKTPIKVFGGFLNFNKMKTFNYTILQTPLQALNIIYPSGTMNNNDIDRLNFYKDSSDSSTQDSSTQDSSTQDSFEEAEEDEEEEEYSTQSSVFDSNDENPRVGGAKGAKKVQIPGINNMTGTNGLLNVVSVENGKYAYIKSKKGFFSLDNIGRYSSKIAKICHHINNSVGIVLVYSQYLDGGLIPLALTLEEAGYQNYSGSLFKTPPIKGKKNKHVYAMITGDTVNAKEIINELTNIKNKDGATIKVILISKSGSEGIDLKYIRQIHVMEPWYNMNRIEQIIGRGVRNGSHAQLPFEQRNVEIYMHSTIIPDTPDLELVDEYIYRIAEIKAKRIGIITKIMKETAVDCILNQEQLNFTEDNFPNKVRLELSTNNKVIDEFQVGDKDYTSQCDYDTCLEPTEHEPNLKLETYNTKFANEGSAYIINSVKSLMLERHFYTSETLITELNHMGKFSIEQIYVALSRMIDEETPIYDKYNKQGTLVNVENYYLFQPIEITNKKITTFERMVPIQAKPTVIVLKMDGEPSNIPNQQNQPQPVLENSLIELRLNYDEIIEAAKDKAIRGEKEWTKICGAGLHLLARMEFINADEIVKLLISYLIDYMNFNKIIGMLNYFTQKQDVIDNDFEGIVYAHIQTKINITSDKAQFICLYDKNIQKISMLNEATNTWEINTEPYNVKKCNDALKNTYKNVSEKLNAVIGFIDYDNVGGLMFKTKDTSKKRNSGAKCINAGKVKTIKQLNAIVGDPQAFTPDNTKTISQNILCIMQEFLMRYYNSTKPDIKWFLTYEEDQIING